MWFDMQSDQASVAAGSAERTETALSAALPPIGGAARLEASRGYLRLWYCVENGS
jgi:hypothetical protein